MATERTVLVRLKASVGDFVAGMGTAKAAVAGLTREIDTTNDRTAWLAQSILALGPALVPIGAAATPILTGIATQFTVAAGAAGVAALAFNGVGDGLKALNEFQLEPTAAHLEKVRQEFEKLGPDGVHFVQFLDDVAPKFEQLQLAARAGMLPGVEEGITNVLDLMPQLKSLTTDLATAMGQLASEAGAGLAGEGFADFFDFMDRQARPLLLDMGHIMGNFAEGFAAMLAAFEPATMAYSRGFLEMSESFAQWAHGLEDSQTFEDFLAYIEQAGPKVADLIGSITDAFVSIVQAAAPVGDVMLPALESFFDVIAKIAATPIGTMFIGITAAMSVYGRAAALASITTGGLGKAFFTAGSGALKGSAGVKTLSADLGVLTRNALTAGAASQRMAAQNAAAAANVRATAKGIGSAAGMAALFAVSMSDIDDKAGLTNATMGAMVGTIGGPWGMAIGGGIGLALDFAAANDEAEAAIKRTNAALKTTDFATINAQASALDGLLDDLAADKDFDWSLNPIQHIQEGWSWAFAQLNDMGDELETTKANAELLAHDLEIAFASIARAMNPDAFKGPGGMDMVPTLEQLGKVAERVTPALADLGISTEEFIAAAQGGGDAWSSMRDEIVTYLSNADSAAGRTDAVADAIAGLDDQLESTVTSAEALKNTLDALLTPGLNLSATTDAWRAGLRNLNDELAENSRSLTAQTDAADQNREAIRGLVTDLKDNLVAQAEAGFGAGELARNLTKQRDALINAGVAAGLSRDELRKYLNELGLTPKLVTTILDARTEEAARKVRAVQELVDRYGMTRAQARAMLDDLASGKIGNVQRLIDKYGLTRARAKAMLADEASGRLTSIQRLLNSLDGKTATTYIRTVTVNGPGIRTGSGGVHLQADGGSVPKTGLPYADRHPYLLADGEEVISNRYGQADRWRPLLKAINANRLADGGTAKYGTYFRPVPGATMPDVWQAAHAFVGATTLVQRGLMAELRVRERMLERALERDKAEMEAAKERLQALKEERRAIAEMVASKFTESPFGQDRPDVPSTFQFVAPEGTEGWSAEQLAAERERQRQEWLASMQVASPSSIIEGQIADLREWRRLRRELMSMGLDGPALMEVLASASIEEMQALVDSGAREVRRYDNLLEQRNRLAGAEGRATGEAMFGRAIDRQTKVFEGLRDEYRETRRETNQELRAIAKRLDKLEDVRRETKNGADRVVNAVKGEVGNAARGRR